MKISDEDAELLYGDASDDALAASWLDKGNSLVVMTRGGKQRKRLNSHGRVDITAPVVEVIDTVGAGDTFQAAMLAHLAETGALDAARLASLAPARRSAACSTLQRARRHHLFASRR